MTYKRVKFAPFGFEHPLIQFKAMNFIGYPIPRGTSLNYTDQGGLKTLCHQIQNVNIYTIT